MIILLLGSGGREHAFAYKIAQSPLCSRLFIAPGNAGTSHCGTNVNFVSTDFNAIKAFCLQEKIELVLVGPEDPLVKGIVDFFLEDEQIRHIPVIGPDQAGAQLEGSKDFAKRFMEKNNIPTAAYRTFTKDSLEDGFRFLEKLNAPYVLKADGLAAGKGVVIIDDLDAAKTELRTMLTRNKFGEAGSRVVIEEFLKGTELSVFVLTDGKNYKILPAAKDYKRIGEEDTGLNTGGMGAISPPPFATAGFLQKVEKQVILPTMEGIKKEKINYRGFIFIGLMKVGDEPYVIEYNCRMGDPETEAVLPRIKTDFVRLLKAIALQELDKLTLEIDSRYAATVMMVSGGYPEAYEKGKVISGLELVDESIIFHAGTQEKKEGIVTSGGRVLTVTSLHDSLEEAVGKSYREIRKINFENSYYRKDIGQDLLKTLPAGF